MLVGVRTCIAATHGARLIGNPLVLIGVHIQHELPVPFTDADLTPGHGRSRWGTGVRTDLDLSQGPGSNHVSDILGIGSSGQQVVCIIQTDEAFRMVGCLVDAFGFRNIDGCIKR